MLNYLLFDLIRQYTHWGHKDHSKLLGKNILFKKGKKNVLLTLCSECRGAYSQEGNDSKQDRLHCYSKIIITDILTIYFFDNDRCAVQHAKVRPLHTLVQKATCITTKCNKEDWL